MCYQGIKKSNYEEVKLRKTLFQKHDNRIFEKVYKTYKTEFKKYSDTLDVNKITYNKASWKKNQLRFF